MKPLDQGAHAALSREPIAVAGRLGSVPALGPNP
jgi:hypothetical protein